MGLKAADLELDAKKKFVLDKLLAAGVTETKEGVSVHRLSYEDLKYELVLQSFRDIDTECEANKYF